MVAKVIKVSHTPSQGGGVPVLTNFWDPYLPRYRLTLSNQIRHSNLSGGRAYY